MSATITDKAVFKQRVQHWADKLWKGLLIAYLGDCEALETELMSRVHNSAPTH